MQKRLHLFTFFIPTLALSSFRLLKFFFIESDSVFSKQKENLNKSLGSISFHFLLSDLPA
jgi:hypothetical protein